MNTPTIEQIDEAINVLNADWLTPKIDGDYKADYIGFTNAVSGEIDTIDYALRVLKRLMQEPSADMIEAARRRPEYGINLYNNIFNAMRDQLLREVEDE